MRDAVRTGGVTMNRDAKTLLTEHSREIETTCRELLGETYLAGLARTRNSADRIAMQP